MDSQESEQRIHARRLSQQSEGEEKSSGVERRRLELIKRALKWKRKPATRQIDEALDLIDGFLTQPKEVPGEECETCRGKGEIEMQPSTNPRPCPDCNGTGKKPPEVVGEALDQLERWMVDYEGEEGGPVETRLSWITGPDGDPTTKRPEAGDYLVRLRDVQALLTQPAVSEVSGDADTDEPDLSPPTLRMLVDAAIRQCRSIEDGRETEEGLPNALAGARGEVSVALLIRELLEEPTREVPGNSGGVEEGTGDSCPDCGSGDRFVLRDPCKRDSHEPHDWHRGRRI